MCKRTGSVGCIVPQEYEVFCGMDVDKKSISATFMDHIGELRTIKVSYNAQNIMNYVKKQFPGRKIVYAYEAGPTGYGLYDDLTRQGNTCIVVSAASIPSARNERVKTNRLDSRKIAENLRGGQLKGIHVPSGEYRELRHATQLRDVYARASAATKLRIKSLLLFEGIAFPEGEGWTVEVKEQLRKIKCSKTVRFKLDQLLNTLEYYKHKVLETSRYIRHMCRDSEELRRNMKYVCSVSGIGSTTASQVLARIGDWRNLERTQQVGAFLGLVPCENSTGDDVNRGSITRMGNRHLRNKLIQCAWAGIRKDWELREFFDRVYRSHNKKVASRVAIVAVARKLTARICAVLKEKRNYEIRKIMSVRREGTHLPGERLDPPQTRYESYCR